MAFRPHFAVGLALYRNMIELPTGQTIPYWEQGLSSSQDIQLLSVIGILVERME